MSSITTRVTYRGRDYLVTWSSERAARYPDNVNAQYQLERAHDGSVVTSHETRERILAEYRKIIAAEKTA